MTQFEQLSTKYLELAAELNTAKDMITEHQTLLKKYHALLLVCGWVDVELETYTYDEVYFLATNHKETIKRYPDLTTNRKRLVQIHAIFLHYLHKGMQPFRTWADVEAAIEKQGGNDGE